MKYIIEQIFSELMCSEGSQVKSEFLIHMFIVPNETLTLAWDKKRSFQFFRVNRLLWTREEALLWKIAIKTKSLVNVNERNSIFLRKVFEYRWKQRLLSETDTRAQFFWIIRTFWSSERGLIIKRGFYKMRNGNIVAKLALREVSINLFIQYKTFQLYNDHFVSLIRREDVCSRIYAETELVSSRNALNGFAFRWTAY